MEREGGESWRLQAIDVAVPLIDRRHQSQLRIPGEGARLRGKGELGFLTAGVAVLGALSCGLCWTYTGRAPFAAAGFVLLALAALRVFVLARTLARPTALRDVIVTSSSLVLVVISAAGVEEERLYHRRDGERLEGRVFRGGYELSLDGRVFRLPEWSAARGEALLREIRRVSRSRRVGGR